MNNLKKKIFLYAIAAPVLLAVFGCENKCAPASENPTMEQSAAAKVDAVWEALNKRPPDMVVVAKLIKANIKTAEEAKMLSEKTSKKGNFYCTYFEEKVTKESAEAVNEVMGLLKSSETKDFFGNTCTKEDGTKVSPLEKLADSSRTGDEPASLDDVINSVVESTPSSVVTVVLDDVSKMNKIVAAGSKAPAEKKDRVLKKVQRSVPQAKAKQFNRAASEAGVTSVKLVVDSQEVIDQVTKTAAAVNTLSLKVLFENLVASNKTEILTLVNTKNFLTELVKLPVDANTQVIWQAIKDNMVEADFRGKMRAAAPNNIFVKLLDRTLVAPVTDEPAALKAVTRMVLRTGGDGQAEPWFVLAKSAVGNVQAKIDNFLDAVVGTPDFDPVYQNINFLDAGAKRPEVIQALIRHADNVDVRNVVRNNILTANKLIDTDLWTSASAVAGGGGAPAVLRRQRRNSATTQGLYKLLIEGNDARWANFTVGRADFPNHLSKIKAEHSLSIFQDMIVREAARVGGNVLANIVNHVTGPSSVFQNIITNADRPPAPAVEDADYRKRLIALLLENGDNATGQRANDEDKVNLVLTAIFQYGTNDAAKTASVNKVASRAANVPRIAAWANQTTTSAAARTVLTAAGAPLAPAALTDQVVADAAATAHQYRGADQIAALQGLLRFKIPALTQAEASALAQQAPAVAAAGRRTFLQAIVGLPFGTGDADKIIAFLTKIQAGNPANLDFLYGGHAAGAAGESIFRSLFPPVAIVGDNVDERSKVIAHVVKLVSADVIKSIDDGVPAPTLANVGTMLDAILDQQPDRTFDVKATLTKAFSGFDLAQANSRDAFAQWAGADHGTAPKNDMVKNAVVASTFASSANSEAYALDLSALAQVALADLTPQRLKALSFLMPANGLEKANALNVAMPGVNNFLRYLFKVPADPINVNILISILGDFGVNKGLTGLQLVAALQDNGNDPIKAALAGVGGDDPALIELAGGFKANARTIYRGLLLEMVPNQAIFEAPAASLEEMLTFARRLKDDAGFQAVLQNIDTARPGRLTATVKWLMENRANKTKENNQTILQIAQAAKAAGPGGAGGNGLGSINPALVTAELAAGANMKKILFYIQLLAYDQLSAGAVSAIVDAGVPLHKLIAQKPVEAESVLALKHYMSFLDQAQFQGLRDENLALGVNVTVADVLDPGVDHGAGIVAGVAARPVGDDPISLGQALRLFWDPTAGALVANPPAAGPIQNQAP